MKKIQALTLIFGYAAFGAIMGWTVLGGVYLKVGRADLIYDLCKMIVLVALPVSLCIVLVFKRVNRFILYAMVPYLSAQILDRVMTHKMDLTPVTGILNTLLYPYPFTLIWVMTLFMYLLDYALTRLLHHGR